MSDNQEQGTEGKKSRTTGFYEAKGMIRRTVILNKCYPETLAKLAEDYGITQGEVVEALLDYASENDLKETFIAKGSVARNAATNPKKITKTAVVKAIQSDKEITPEKLAQIEAILKGTTAP